MDDRDKSRESQSPEQDAHSLQLRELKDSEARLQKEISFLKQKLGYLNVVFEQIPAFFWTTDKNLVFTSSSGRALARLGMRSQDVIGHSAYEFLDPGSHDNLDKLRHEKALQGETSHFEHCWKGLLCDVYVGPLQDEKGDIIGTVGVAFDITDLKKRDEERNAVLKISQRLIAPLSLLEFARILAAESRRLFNYHSFAFFLYQEDRRILNIVLAEDTPPDGNVPVIIHEQKSIEISRSRIRTLVKTPQLINRKEEPGSTEFDPFCFESRLSRSILIVPIYWKEEMIGSIVLSSYEPDRYGPADLTILESLANMCGGAVARLRFEESLNTKDRAMESCINAVAFLDLEGKIFYVNHSFLSLFDYDDREDVLHRSFPEFWKDRESADRLLGDVRDRGWYTGFMTAVREDGSLFEAQVSSTLIPEGSEMPGYILISLLDVTPKTLSEKALRVAQYSIENIRDAVFWASPDGHFSYVNQAACRLSGYSREELLSMAVKDIDPSYQGEKFNQKLREIKEDKIHIVHSSILTREGEKIPVEISLNYLNVEGEEYVCAFMRDISERVKAEQELKNAHELYRSVIRNDRGYPYFCDFRTLKYEFFCDDDKVAGIPIRGLSGQKMKKYVRQIIITDPETTFTNSNDYARAFREGRVPRYLADYRIVDPGGGAERWLSDCSLPVFDPATQTVIGSQGILHDITDRKMADQVLKKSHELYCNVIRNDRGYPYYCDLSVMRYQFFCDEGDIAGIPIRGGLDVERLLSYVKECIVTDPEVPYNNVPDYGKAFVEGRAKRFQVDYRIVNPAGKERWLSVCSVPVHDPVTGKVIGSQGIFHDITDRKMAEAERESLQRISRRLLPAMMIHEMGRIIAEEAGRIFRHDAFWFSLYDKSQNMLKRVYVEDTPLGADKPVETSFDETLKLGKKYPIYSEGKPRLINRMEEPSRSDLIPFGDEERLSRSLMFVPVMSQGCVIGVISIQSYAPGRYTQKDLDLLQTFADQCGPAVERAQLYESLHIKDLAIESAHSGVALLDLEGKVMYANRAFLALWDYDDPGYVIGKPFSKFLESKTESQHFLDTIQKEDAWVGDLKARQEDGSPLHVRGSASLIRDLAGKPLCIGAAFFDLSGEILTNETLYLAQHTLEHANDLIFWFKSDGSIFYANDAASRLLGYTNDELSSMNLTDIDPTFIREDVASRLKILKEKGHDIRETVLRTRDGYLVPVEASVNFLKFGDEELVCAFARDVTERRRSAEALQMSEEKYRLLVENTDAMILNVNEAGVVLAMNKSASSCLGGNPEDFIGRTMWDFLPANIADNKMGLIREVIRSGKGTMDMDRILFPIGERWLNASIVPIRDSQGSVISALVVATDVTSTRHMEEELEESLSELKYMKMIYQAILRGTPYGLCMISPEWHVVWANHAMKKTLDPEDVMPEMKGISFGEFFPTEKDFLLYRKSAIENVRKSGFDTRKHLFHRENGSPLLCEISLVRVDPAQTAPGFVVTITPLPENNKE